MPTDLTAGTDAERIAELERRSQLASELFERYATNTRIADGRQRAINDAIDILQWGHVDEAPPAT